jgi:hypothetical protein
MESVRGFSELPIEQLAEKHGRLLKPQKGGRPQKQKN